MSEQSPKIRVSKLDAACRQLRTAITLWFTGGDPIAIHTLAFAAYEVLHHLSKKRDPFRRDLIFDTDHIKVEHLGDWNKLIRRHANFFKHADRDGDSVIEFDQSAKTSLRRSQAITSMRFGDSLSASFSKHLLRPALARVRAVPTSAGPFPSKSIDAIVISFSANVERLSPSA
jgi:hypothetical protein